MEGSLVGEVIERLPLVSEVACSIHVRIIFNTLQIVVMSFPPWRSRLLS